MPMDPVSEGLLQLFEVRADRQQAELDLERAKAKEAIKGRSTVPGVLAQLQQKAMKEAKQREQIQKQGEAQGPSAQAMVPPQVDVSGAPQGRGGAGASVAGEILDRVIGGKGIKQQGIALGAGQMGPQGGAAPQPGAITGQPGGPAMQQLSGGQRALRGIGGAVTRNVGLVEEAITGQEQVGTLATVPEMTAPMAKPMAIYQTRRTSKDPAVAQAAEQQYQDRLDQVRQEFSSQFGPEVADEAIRTLEMQASNLRLEAEEVQRLKSEDPAIADERAIGRLKADLVEGKITLAQLTPGQKAILDLEKKGTNVSVQILSPPTKAELEQRSVKHFDMLNRLGSIEAAANQYPEFFTYEERVKVAGLEQLSMLGMHLSEDQVTQVQKFRSARQAFSTLKKDTVRVDAGATMAPHEVEMVLDTLPEMGMSYAGYQQAAADFRQLWALDTFRDLTMRAAGLSEDPAMARSFAETGQLAQGAANARIEQLMDTGMDADTAWSQAAGEFRGAYGMDLERLFATPAGR